MSDFPDSNGNGIPDAFEHRPPLTEILNPPSDTFTVEIERVKRPPKKGEYCMMSYGFDRAPFDYKDLDFYVVRRVVAGEIPDPDEPTML